MKNLAPASVIARSDSDEAISWLLERRDCLATLAMILGKAQMNYRQYYVYIMTNENNTALYTGVTNDLQRRCFEHKGKLVKGFTKRYNIDKLVYYEASQDVESAILREKQIKGGSRQKKIKLVNSMNREWRDLYEVL